MPSLELQILLLAALLALSAFLSCTETALFGLSSYEKRKLERRGDRAARNAIALMEGAEGLALRVLLANTLVQAVTVGISVDLGIREMGLAAGAPIGALGAAILTLLVGEAAPKVLGVARPLSVAQRGATALRLLTRPLAGAASGMSRVAGAAASLVSRGDAQDEGRSGEEPRSREGEGIGVPGSLAGQDLLEYLGEFEETVVREIMTPRVEMLAGNLDWPHQRIQNFARNSRRSRLPFFRGSIDDVDGVLQVKPYLLLGESDPARFLEPAYFIPEGKRIRDLLREFRHRELEIAIVLDEHGQTTGLVTTEDILEELFGEVYDVGEEERIPPVAPLAGGGWRALGKALVEEVEQETGLDLEADEGIDRLAGLVMNYLGEIPARGESFILSNHQFTISKVVRHRVQEVLIRPLGRKDGPPQEDSET